jgi:hypothetical protein
VSTLAVCIDCAMRGANGYEPDMTDYATGHRHRYEAATVANGGAYPMPSTDTDAHFSWEPCQYCGDINGGDRIPSHLVGGSK